MARARTKAATPPDGTYFRACNLCEAICGIAVQVEAGVVKSIRGDPDDPFSRGHVCAKAVALKDLKQDPDRLRQPVRRTASGFETIAWDEAFDAAATGLRRTRDRYGTSSLAIYAGNPNVHNWGSMLFNPVLYRALGARNRYSATSVDQLPHHLAAWAMFGHQLLLPIPDIDRTDFFLILGGNPAVSNGSLMTAPDFKKRLQAVRARGGTVVVVDPRRTETAALADRHHFIRPGADALLLAAMIHTLLEEKLAAPGRLAGMVDGLDEIAGHLAPFAADQVAPATGIEAEVIRDLARQFATAPSAVAHGRIGLSLQPFGGLCQWLINVLNILTGNLDRPGGALFTTPAVDVVEGTGPGGFARFASRVRGLPEFGGELPVATMAEDMLTGDADRIRALLTIAGNPVLSTPNGAQVDQALAGLDFMVAVDFYINETTRHADIILPPTAGLEHDHYDLIFNALAVRNVARYSPALFAGPVDTRHDWQIALALADRLQAGNLGERLKARLTRWWMARKGPTGLLASQLAKGPYASELDFDALAAAPHGVDLGPLQSRLPGRLKTPDQKIRLAPAVLTGDLPRLAAYCEQSPTAPGDPMVLIGRRLPRSNNSWMHNYPRLVKGKPQCTLLMHPADAKRLSLGAGAPAVISSRVGEVTAPVQLSEDIMPGVVSLPHGFGHGRGGVRMGVAAGHPGVSINDLTDHERVDTLSGNAALSGVPVDIRAAESKEPQSRLATDNLARSASPIRRQRENT